METMIDTSRLACGTPREVAFVTDCLPAGGWIRFTVPLLLDGVEVAEIRLGRSVLTHHDEAEGLEQHQAILAEGWSSREARPHEIEILPRPGYSLPKLANKESDRLSRMAFEADTADVEGLFRQILLDRLAQMETASTGRLLAAVAALEGYRRES
jgi:hypothetical protein